MKKFVKIIALVLALVSLMAVAAPALAAPSKCKHCNASVTIKNSGGEYGVKIREETIGNKHYYVYEMRQAYSVTCKGSTAHTYSGYDVKYLKYVHMWNV